MGRSRSSREWRGRSYKREWVGNRRAPARGGHGTHWREGKARADVTGEGDIVETQNSGAMCTKPDRLSAPGAGGYPGTRGVSPLDEPAAGNLHGGVCEGGEFRVGSLAREF